MRIRLFPHCFFSTFCYNVTEKTLYIVIDLLFLSKVSTKISKIRVKELEIGNSV